jgi:hypothetical protein
MCRCQRFPAYAHALGVPRVKAALFDHLCLMCIHDWCVNNYHLDLCSFWTKKLDKLWDMRYSCFYTWQQREEFRFAESAAVRAEETVARLEPWLQKRGWKVLGYDDQALTECVISVEWMKGKGEK